MKTRLRFWFIAVPMIALYIVAMSSRAAPGNGNGPKAYASPNGYAWGFGHGKGQPDKRP